MYLPGRQAFLELARFLAARKAIPSSLDSLLIGLARRLHASGMLEPVLALLASALITYSIVTVGLSPSSNGMRSASIGVMRWCSARCLFVVHRSSAPNFAALGALLVAVAVGINLMPTVSLLATA